MRLAVKKTFEYPVIEQWRKVSVYVLKILQMAIAVSSIVVIAYHTSLFIYYIGMVVAATNIISTASILASALAVDFCRCMDIANLGMLILMYFATSVLWMTRYFMKTDDRAFVIALGVLDLVMIVLFIMDFMVHYTVMHNEGRSRSKKGGRRFSYSDSEDEERIHLKQGSKDSRSGYRYK